MAAKDDNQSSSAAAAAAARQPSPDPSTADSAAEAGYSAAANAVDGIASAAARMEQRAQDAFQSTADYARPAVEAFTASVAKVPQIGLFSNDLFSPEVVSEKGGDFGGSLDTTAEPVILRIEIASSGEVKAMRLLTWIITLFAVLITVSFRFFLYRVSPLQGIFSFLV